MKQLTLLLLFSLISTLFAQIKFVPTDYEIIQHAIDDAEEGDIIIVEEGVYYQQINFKGKAITVASEFFLDGDTSHISKTIIDGLFLPEKDSSSLVYFDNGEDSTSLLCGLTLQNGKGTKIFNPINPAATIIVGGAIFVDSSGAKIKNNIIKNNSIIIDNYLNTYIKTFGGGIEANYLPKSKSLIIKSNIFKGNKGQGKVAMGGAMDIFLVEGKLVISGNRIIGNRIKAKDSGYGGGISISDHTSDVVIENNYIAHNSAYSSAGHSKGAGIAAYFAQPIIRNNIIVFNKTDYPILFAKNAFGGGIAVFWNIKDDWGWKVDPYSLVAKIENNTIAYNNEKNSGGGVAFRDVGAIINNNIIGCNFSDSDAQIKVEFLTSNESDSRTIKLEYNNIEGGCEEVSKFFEGDGNISQFPQFEDEDKWYLKRDLSPCIDTGDPSQEYEDIEDPAHSGKACFPALGTKRNDMGAFGGPHSKWQEMSPTTDIEEFEKVLPQTPYLSQNYPNPFNPTTTIEYSIPADGKIKNSKLRNVTLKIYNILGREVATLVNEKQKPGNYEVIWNPSAEGIQLPSGVYFYILTAGDFTKTRKMILLK